MKRLIMLCVTLLFIIAARELTPQKGVIDQDVGAMIFNPHVDIQSVVTGTPVRLNLQLDERAALRYETNVSGIQTVDQLANVEPLTNVAPMWIWVSQLANPTERNHLTNRQYANQNSATGRYRLDIGDTCRG